MIKSNLSVPNSKFPVPLISFCGSVGCMSKLTLSLICLPSVDFHWGVYLLVSSNP